MSSAKAALDETAINGDHVMLSYLRPAPRPIHGAAHGRGRAGGPPGRGGGIAPPSAVFEGRTDV